MNDNIDWFSIPMRASCMGKLMTEPRDAATKKAGGLSKTAISHLCKVYAWEKYGRKKDIVTKAMQKGIMVEEESITLLSQVEKKMYKKNEERLSNKYFTGLPDMYEGAAILKAKSVEDIKSSWDLETFLVKEVEEVDKDYYWQLQVYCDLTGAKKASVKYCLVTAPQSIIEQEKRNLLWRMNVATEDNEEYKLAAAELEYNMMFDDITKPERVISFDVERNDEDIQAARDKVSMCQKWLYDFDKKRMGVV